MGSVVSEGIAVKPKVPPDEDSTVAIQMYKTIAQMDPGNLLHTVCLCLIPWGLRACSHQASRITQVWFTLVSLILFIPSVNSQAPL